mmetsp:Transcript_15795/g.49122  ORF Transcript_15795/g.49122 Transcript_15795/m.49122 type:complete len:200 (+) Transcript_15795:2253-2852(+)
MRLISIFAAMASARACAPSAARSSASKTTPPSCVSTSHSNLSATNSPTSARPPPGASATRGTTSAAEGSSTACWLTSDSSTAALADAALSARASRLRSSVPPCPCARTTVALAPLVSATSCRFSPPSSATVRTYALRLVGADSCDVSMLRWQLASSSISGEGACHPDRGGDGAGTAVSAALVPRPAHVGGECARKRRLS